MSSRSSETRAQPVFTPRLQRGQHVIFQALASEDGAVLLHLDRGEYHGLNPVGVQVWEALSTPRTLAELIVGTAAAFRVAPERISQDVEDFVESLVVRRLACWEEGN